MYRNPLLDRLPTEFEGYLIRTDFRIAIQIIQALSDNELDDYEKTAVACNLLYGNGTPPIDIAVRGIEWFISGGITTSNSSGGNQRKCFDYDFDSERVCSGFKRTYGVDINRVEMHWFEFRWCLADFGDVALTQVMEYRNANTAKMPKEQKAAYQKMKRIYAIPDQQYTEKEKAEIAEFIDQLNQK